MRSTYGLEVDRDSFAGALCASRPDDWSALSWTKRGWAAHVCGHCPALAACRRELERTPADRLVGVVVAGVPHGERGLPIGWTPPRMKCGWCDGR
jgi:hypothetical protein